MEKVKFELEGVDETEAFYVLEQTKINGAEYILVTDSQEGDAVCMILKKISENQNEDSIYEVVEDEVELEVVSRVFEELLEDVDIEL